MKPQSMHPLPFMSHLRNVGGLALLGLAVLATSGLGVAAQDRAGGSTGAWVDDDPQGEPTLVLYAVEDLVAVPSNWKPEPTDLDQTLDGEAQRRRAVEQLQDALLADIRDFVLPGLSAAEGTSLDFIGEGALAMSARGDDHRSLRRFLDHRRRQVLLDRIAPSLVMIEPRLLRVRGPEDSPEAPALPALTLPGEVLARGGLELSILPDAGAGPWFEELMRRHPDAERVDSSRLSLFPGQPGRVQTTRQVAYVSEYEIETGVAPLGEDVRIASPVIEVVHHGDILEVQAVGIDSERIGMRLKWTSAHLHEPIATVDTEYGPVSRPVVDIRKVETHVLLASGQCAIVRSAGDPDFLMLVSVQVAEMEISGAPADGEGR